MTRPLIFIGGFLTGATLALGYAISCVMKCVENGDFIDVSRRWEIQRELFERKLLDMPEAS